ncbi:MAG: Xaa-Pro peptidase family protein [Candidatus Omnitrophica bacterium]|nr:Xaa-Pro peptidase family protein [Candidatus Omnitrophota bacterium]
MNEKIRKICTAAKKQHIDVLLITSSANISYLTGYPSRDSWLLVSADKCFYLTDSRYGEEAKQCLKGICVEQVDCKLFARLGDICRKLNAGCVGFEERFLSYAEYTHIRKALPESAGLVPTVGLVEELRRIKTAAEILAIRQATAIAVKAFRFACSIARPGLREVELAGEMERFIRFHGAACASFPIIVASGPNSSYPHHLTSERKLKEREPVLIDLGVEYKGYKSDLTRVILLGKIKPSIRRIYDIVLEAQARAIAAVRPHAAAGDIDRAARDYIAQKGFGGCFGHGTGHGIGLEVHEEPRIGTKQTVKLQPGMVFTVEPAIYLPGQFGIRLEDMVLVTEKGRKVLSGALDK